MSIKQKTKAELIKLHEEYREEHLAECLAKSEQLSELTVENELLSNMVKILLFHHPMDYSKLKAEAQKNINKIS